MSRRLEDSIFGDEHHDDVHPDDIHHDDGYADDVHRDASDDVFDQEHPDAAAAAPARESRAARPRHQDPPARRARSRSSTESSTASKLLVPLIALALLAGLGVGAYMVLSPMLQRAMTSDVADYPGPGSGEVTITVNPGDSGAVIAQQLVDEGVIASTRAFNRASDADPAAAAAIQPGDYTLMREMTAADALAALNDGENRYLGERVTIREGLWKSEVFAALSEATGIPVEDYEAAAEDTEAIGLPAQAEGDVEGWLFPATYTLRTDQEPTEHLKTLIDQAKSQLTAAGAPEDEWQRILNIAAMVEGEAREAEELGKVARVIENRLDDPSGPTVGFLQMDSTVNYALQKRGNLTRTEYEEAKSNPYDTYAFKGLPPGPIGNPGRAAIDAATNPPEGPWFFFVTVNLDTGETLFAETFEEHNRNDRQRVQWCQDNPGKCTGGG